MGKKSKTGKKRLDKYYYLAKEHGFRSRAAFKLIQLNKKYHFLQSSTVLIDLCAAPGGWCQVASKEMPVSSIKIGIDLDPIKPIPGVTTFQCDITSEQCRHLIKKEIKHLKADVVLHDGAPNVGGQWSKDSYGQSELVLFAIKLACEFLKEGGWFISKVFRSSDYNSLIYVMRKLFNNVEATKPLASRSQAAEIFVVCSGYKNPSFIDSKLLDPKFALKQIESENEIKSNSLKSIKSIFEQKKNRGGYNSDSLFIVKSLKNFIECDNPYEFLAKSNKIKIESDDCNKYLNEVKPKFDYKMYFDDIQILGKQEFKELIVWRNKIRSKLHFERNEKKDEKKEEKKEKTMEELIDEELKKYEKSRLAKQIKEKKKQEKILLKNKQSYIEQEENPLDNDIEVDDKLFEYIQKNNINIEELENINQEKENDINKKDLGEYDEVALSDLDEDDYIDMMNDDIEENAKLYEEERGINLLNKKKKNKKKEKKNENDIQLVEKEESDSDNEKNDKSDSENEEGDNSSDYYSKDNDNDNENFNNNNNKNIPIDEDEDIGIDDINIKNPLRKQNKKNKKENKEDIKEEINEEDNLSSDTEEEIKENKKLKNKKEKKEKNQKKENKNENKKEKEKEKDDSSDDGYDTDEKAEIRAIAKKMLRKKTRLEILNKSYNRYAFEDDDKVPKWFLDEEKLHNVPQKPITKQEVLAEKEYLRKINVRIPKKVLEAKARKKNKLQKRLQKIRQKAEAISKQDEYTEISKVKQIEKLYKKELSKGKERKKYIISRANRNNVGKDSRFVKHVDRRLKKDKRALKVREKRQKRFRRRK